MVRQAHHERFNLMALGSLTGSVRAISLMAAAPPSCARQGRGVVLPKHPQSARGVGPGAAGVFPVGLGGQAPVQPRHRLERRYWVIFTFFLNIHWLEQRHWVIFTFFLNIHWLEQRHWVIFTYFIDIHSYTLSSKRSGHPVHNPSRC